MTDDEAMLRTHGDGRDHVLSRLATAAEKP
jgi:hypothetical protein